MKKIFAIVGPGVLVAATGVGAGDLATAAFTGGVLGVTILWAVLLGAFFKFVLNEGLARWQLATGRTLIEGCFDRFGKGVRWFFLIYLMIWSFLVAATLMSAIGVTAHAIYPLFGEEAIQTNKVVYGVLHSLLAVVLVRLGGYSLFEKLMALCIAVMFVVVVITGVVLRPAPSEFIPGLLVPRIPDGGALWTIALMGGVGGTVTVLSYGYWIQEKGRTGSDSLATCRIDLAVGYVMTALFGIGMVVIGNSLGNLDGGGAGLIVKIAEKLQVTTGAAGPALKWAFLAGAWGAVFSSLFGVWQGIPYLFADIWSLHSGGDQHENRVDVTSFAYRGYLYALSLLPMVGLVAVDFRTIQKTYAVVGALFLPMLALVLLILNGRKDWVGKAFKNSLATSIVLVAIILFFLFAGCLEVRRKLGPATNVSPPQAVETPPDVSSEDVSSEDLNRGPQP